MESSRRGDICNFDVHRATFAKHLRSKKHLEKTKQEQMTIREWLFREPTGKLNFVPREIYNRKP